MARAQSALRDGRRLLALQRLRGAARATSRRRPTSRPGRPRPGTRPRFEAEWKRMGGVLHDRLAAPRGDALAAVSPAPRARGRRGGAAAGAGLLRREPRVRPEHRAGVRPLLPGSGPGGGGGRGALPLALGPGRASRAAARARAAARRSRRSRATLLAAYRPPARSTRTADFITASAALKEARELDAAGLRYGALLRYLQASLALRPAPPGRARPIPPGIAERLRELDVQLASGQRRPQPRAALPRERAGGAGGRLAPGRGHRRRDRRRRPAPLLRGPRARDARAAAGRAARHGHARPLALHLKPLRPGRSAGRERRAGSTTPGSSSRTTARRRWRSASASRATRSSSSTTCSSRSRRTSASSARARGRTRGATRRSQSAASHERFRADLSRVIDLLERRPPRRRGRRRAAARGRPRSRPCPRSRSPTSTAGRSRARTWPGAPVLVEFWATWCPPCRGTLGWLGELRRRHGDRLVVLAVALESDEADVRRVASQAGAPLRWAMGTPEVARAFGDVSAMPTLLLFDGQGKPGRVVLRGPARRSTARSRRSSSPS